MIIARLHKGSLDEAMETAKTFETVEDMKKWYAEAHESAFSQEDVIIKDEEVYDDRIGWNTHYVCTKRYKDKKYEVPQCIGMCDLNYEKH